MTQRAVRVLSALVVLLTTTGATTTSEGKMTNVAPSKGAVTYTIPFRGPGQLATIWSSGPNGPYGGVLVITNRHGSQRVAVDAPFQVRWRSPTELILEQDYRPMKGNFGERILRIDRSGRVLEVLSDRDGLSAPQPAPGGRWLGLQLNSEHGVRGLEVRDLDNGFQVVTSYPRSPTFDPLFATMVWSPDATQLVATTMVDDPKDKGTLWARMVLLHRETSDTSRRIHDAPGGIDRQSHGVMPLFWNDRGLYVRGDNGVLRCDPQGSGCVDVYSPGIDRRVVAGTAVGNDQALLLVQDLRLDPFEVRAKEIHRVDLATGKGSLLLRLPAGVFINDIDWIKDPPS